jgi:hypothetical protein
LSQSQQKPPAVAHFALTMSIRPCLIKSITSPSSSPSISCVCVRC